MKINAREHNPPIIQELLNEITPEETEATELQMQLLDFASWILKHYSIQDDGGFHYVNSMGEYTPTYKVIQHYLEDEQD